MNQDENKALEKENQNATKTVEKNEKTLLNDKNEEKNVFEDVEETENKNENKNSEKNEEETDIETPEEETDWNNFMNEWGDDDEDLDLEDIEEEETDPLEGFQGEHTSDTEPPPMTENVKDVKERVSSERNRKNIERLGAKVLGKADLFKATLCSKISGKHLAEYIADEETIDILIECIKEYLETQEVVEPSPFAALMIAFGMWTLPPLGVALLDRYSIPKEEKSKAKRKTSKNLNNEAPNQGKQEEQIQEESKVDYSELKEFKEKRKTFTVNAAGQYNRVPDGKKYIAVEYADEYPSPEVREWLEEGKKCREIRKLLGYG